MATSQFENPCLGRIVFSQRPIGPLHIGQLVGSLRPVTSFQEHYETLFVVADGTPGTTVDAEKRSQIHELLAGWLAAGLSPNESVIVQLSQLFELNAMVNFLLPLIEDDNLAPLPGAVETLPEAALLLLFGASHTPAYPSARSAGDLASVLVARLNDIYKLNLQKISWLPLPVGQLAGTDGQPMWTARRNAIWLMDSEEETTQKVMLLPTKVLLTYLEHFVHEPAEQSRVINDFQSGAITANELRSVVALALNESLHSLRVKREKWLAAPDELDHILKAGLQRGKLIADENLAKMIK